MDFFIQLFNFILQSTKEMLYVKNEKEGIKAVRTHIPNVIFHEISKVCGVKPVSVPR